MKILGKNVIFFTDTGKIFRVGENIIKVARIYEKIKQKDMVLNKCVDIGIKKEEAEQILDKLIKEEKEKVNSRIVKNEFSLNSLCLLIAQECNLSCVYCYGDGGRYGEQKTKLMKYETAIKALEFLLKNRHKNTKVMGINFFGGEPLINFPLIKRICSYIRKNLNNYRFVFSITTNGTLINNEIVNFLKENKFSVICSIDGPPKIQNRNRPFKNGKPSYKRVLSGLKKLIKDDSIREKLSLRATLINVNEIEEVIYHLKKIGGKYVFVEKGAQSYFNHLKCKEFDLGNLDRIFKKIIIDIENGKSNPVLLQNSWISLMKMIYQRRLKFRYCGAGKNFLAISTEGKIYPCHRLVGINEFEIGNVDEGITHKEKLNQFIGNLIFKSKKCNGCWAKFFCGGGCYATNWFVNQDIYEPAEEECKLIKKEIENLIHLLCYYKDRGLLKNLLPGREDNKLKNKLINKKNKKEVNYEGKKFN